MWRQNIVTDKRCGIKRQVMQNIVHTINMFVKKLTGIEKNGVHLDNMWIKCGTEKPMLKSWSIDIIAGQFANQPTVSPINQSTTPPINNQDNPPINQSPTLWNSTVWRLEWRRRSNGFWPDWVSPESKFGLTLMILQKNTVSKTFYTLSHTAKKRETYIGLGLRSS